MATIIQIIENSGSLLAYMVAGLYVVMGVLFAAARIAASLGLAPEEGKSALGDFLANFK